MKIVKRNAGHLTNFELFDFLRSRGATSDPMACLGSVAPSECKVFDYLDQTPASRQTRESVNEFLLKTDKFHINASEKLNLLNLVPRTQPVLYGLWPTDMTYSADAVSVLAICYQIIKDCEKRLVRTEDHAQELLELLEEIFPQPDVEEEPQEELSQ